MKVCIVLGTRPELIKFTPIIEALQSKSEIELCVINTGQHADLLEAVPHLAFQESIYWPHGSENAPLNWKLAHIVQHLDIPLGCHKPAIVLVQGDTTSALAGALAAANLQLKVGHVEAGLRTYRRDSPFPEENNRRLISQVTDYHFCISAESEKNLRNECTGGLTYVVGSTAIEMVLRNQDPIEDKNIVLTLHRRENIESGDLEAYVKAIVEFLDVHSDVGCTWFTHPNPKVQEVANKYSHERLGKFNATTHEVFMKYCRWAWAICSDSGGIQEENTILQKPLFIMREVTERPEVVDNHITRLVYPGNIKYWLDNLYQRPEQFIPGNQPYGVGGAGQTIANIISNI